MKRRCKRTIQNHSCGRERGHEWPHSYVANSMADRVGHELRLYKLGYTTRTDMIKAILLKRRSA